MKKFIRILLGLSSLAITSCAIPSVSQPTLNVNPYLSSSANETVNAITFEVQKVLDTLSSLKESHTLGFVEKLNYPGWTVRKETGHILFLKTHTFIAEKVFDIPKDCIRSIDGAEMNICHIKLVQTLPKLGKAFGCGVKVYQIRYPLREKVVISCDYGNSF
jgi:hypothetical protein